jgi:hypothetical protein
VNDVTALWPSGLVTFRSQTRLRGAPPEGTVTVAVMLVLELTTTEDAVGAGPEPCRKVTVAPLMKLVPVMVTDPEVPTFSPLGLIPVIVGAVPTTPEVTSEVFCAVLLVALVSVPRVDVAVSV